MGLEQAAGSESVLPLKLTVYLAIGVAAWSRLNHASATLALLAWSDLGVVARTILQVCLPSSSEFGHSLSQAGSQTMGSLM